MRKVHPKPEGVKKYRGVSWDSKRGLWRCQITIDGMHQSLGWFNNPFILACLYDYCKTETTDVGGPLKRRAKTNADLGLIPPLKPETVEMLKGMVANGRFSKSSDSAPNTSRLFN